MKGLCRYFSKGSVNCTCLKGVDFKELVKYLSGSWVSNIPCTRETDRVLCIYKKPTDDGEVETPPTL